MKRIITQLYAWVLLGIILGILVGHFDPKHAVELKLFGDIFIKLIKMLIVPIIFCTICLGLAKMHDMRKVGRIAGKAFIYFEIVSSLALFLGLLMVNTLKPGAGLNLEVASFDPHLVAGYVSVAKVQTISHFFMQMIPVTFFDALVKGDILQALLVAILFGMGLASCGARAKPVVDLMTLVSEVLFKIINRLMWLAPIGAFGAMAYTIGQYGIVTLLPLLKLVLCFYSTCLIFILVVLGLISKSLDINIFKLLVYIKEELLLVLGTSSSETALATLMEKLEALGCSEGVVGLVVPMGYSFNLDGTNIYLTMAAIFIAQALNIPLTLPQQLMLLLVAMLTSKGASGVTGAGFVALAATLAVVPSIPVAGLVIILGVDRFMSEARSLTNIIGNTVATLAIAAWEKELDRTRLNAEL